MTEELMKDLNEGTHFGADAMADSLKHFSIGPKMKTIANQIVQKWPVCYANSSKIQPKPPSGESRKGMKPGEYWQVDFSELPRQGSYRYLLVLVDTFTGWPEAFPCQTKKLGRS